MFQQLQTHPAVIFVADVYNLYECLIQANPAKIEKSEVNLAALRAGLRQKKQPVF